jgi:hypothetical protein
MPNIQAQILDAVSGVVDQDLTKVYDFVTKRLSLPLRLGGYGLQAVIIDRRGCDLKQGHRIRL